MGLDMYLNANRYIGGGWDHASDEDKSSFGQIIALMGLERNQVERSVEVKVGVGYWRKANAIHKWFVENVQGGVDECQSSYVEREQLTTLKELCEKVLASSPTTEGNVHTSTVYQKGKKTQKNFRKGEIVSDPSAAIELLPTTSGFFFGGTDYDECYIQDLKDTIAIIDRCLSMPECWSFEYRASW